MGISSSSPQKVALALGSNLGDRAASLRAAVAALTPHVVVTAVSPVYETPAAYVTDQPAFLNATLIGETSLEPLALLHAVRLIETGLGRQPTFRYGPRVIDIDILFHGDCVMTAPELTLPHPGLAEREFVLRPLADIAPDWKHAPSGLTIAALLARLPKCEAARVVEDI